MRAAGRPRSTLLAVVVFASGCVTLICCLTSLLSVIAGLELREGS